MANLGSNDTPVNGESFNLPAGASIDEDNGDFVIKNSNGTIVLRHDETSGEWQFESNDLTGVGDVDASSATLDDATVANSPTNSTDVVRKSETDAIDNQLADKVEQTDFDDHNTRHEDGGADEINVGGLSGNLADQQDPTDHTHDGTADSGGGSLNPNATTLQDTQEPTTNGEIRRSGSDVFVHTSGQSRNVSNFLTASQVEKLWTEDANSPKTVTNTSSISYNPNTTFDLYKIFVSVDSPDRTLAKLTLNNDSGNNYDYYTTNGNKTSDDDKFFIGTLTDSNGGIASFSCSIMGRWGGYAGISIDGPYPARVGAVTFGSNDNINSPLSTFEFDMDGVKNKIVLEVYGRDVA